MEANVSSVTAGMWIFGKYNSQARVEFWDGYMVVFASDVGTMSDLDVAYLLKLGWKMPDKEGIERSKELMKGKVPDFMNVWEYGL